MDSILDQLRKRIDVMKSIDEAQRYRVKLRAEAPGRVVKQMRRELVAASKATGASSILDRLTKRADAFTQARIEVPDIERICALPIIPHLKRSEIETFCREYVLAEPFDRGFRLFENQCRALLEYIAYKGLLGPIGVGKGKTLISVKIPDIAWRKGLRKILLLVPSSVYGQLTRNDLQWIRQHVAIQVPFHGLGSLSSKGRLALAYSGRKGCYILPYSCLSTQDSVEVLRAVGPECIVLDEAHLVKNAAAARTKRLREYVRQSEQRGNEVELVALSGTITNKSILDYHHLIGSALRQLSPLPISPIIANEWATVLDADADMATGDTGPIEPLVAWARRNFPKANIPFGLAGFRSAYRLRLTTAPGVVATSDSSLKTSLTLCTRAVKRYEEHKDWAELNRLMTQVIDEWTTPTGDEIDHAIHTFKWLYELTSGFYNRLSWPEPDVLATRTETTVKRATRMLSLAMEHHEVAQEYARELRAWLRTSSRPGLDTPMTVGKSMSKDGDSWVTKKLYDIWLAKKELEHEFKTKFSARRMMSRDSDPVRVCSFKIDQMVNWVTKTDPKGAIIWVYHTDLGTWAFDALKEAGVDPLHCIAGEHSNRVIRDHKNGDRIIVASMSAHGTGKNLQHFQHSYFLQWPRSATLAEQVLGRMHRTGQKADELNPRLNNTTEFDVLNFAACLNDALYNQQTTGNRQRLIYCAYDPLPAVFPVAVLRERGFQPKKLNSIDSKSLMGRFKAEATAAVA